MIYFRIPLLTILLSTLLIGSMNAQRPAVDSHRSRIDDGELEKARNEYWNEIKTSGTEKDLGKIELDAFHAFLSLGRDQSFKSESIPAWQSIATSTNRVSSGRTCDIAVHPGP